MFSNLFIALRYLTGRNSGGARYLLGAVAGISLSLVPVIVTLIVADGMIRGITDRFIELGTGHIQVWPYRETSGEEDAAAEMEAEDAEILSLIQETQGVRGVWRQRESLGIIAGSKGKIGISIRAINNSLL